MAITAAILNYRRFLKRRNYSAHTIKNYMHTLKQFVVWVDVPIEAVTHKKLRPTSITCWIEGCSPRPSTAIWTASGGFTTTSLKKSRWPWSIR